MPERRSYDPLLQQLFDQAAQQHQENRSDLKEVIKLVNGLLTVDGEHENRIGNLEDWRKETADPAIADYKNTKAQITGGFKLAGWIKATILLLGGGAILKYGPVIFAALAKFAAS